MHDKLWQITEYPFHADKLNHHETIFTIGNGYLGTRATFEEGYEGDIPSTLVHGIYDHATGMLVPELANFPNWLDFRLKIDGTPFKMITKSKDFDKPPQGLVLGFQRTLHMNKGLLRREVLFRAASGNIVRVIFERFASLHDVHVLAQRVSIIAVDGQPTIEIESGIDGNVAHNLGVNHWGSLQMNGQGNVIEVSGVTGQSNYQMGMAARLVTDLQTTYKTDKQRAYLSASTSLNKFGKITFDKITTIYTSRDVESDPLTAARKHLDNTANYDQLLKSHVEEWANYWSNSDIQIKGDDQAQIATRFTTYHLLIAAPREDDGVSVGAKTLSGFGYKGHVFWDTELFILPPLTLTQPRIARNLLMYRYNRLEGARRKAAANGYQGAMFPWESTDTGEETTPQWSDPQPDGTRIRIWTGDNEQHISTDIAYAVHQYWQWTGDDEFMRLYGAEIILDTANFWGSRVEEKNGRYELSNQIGPDEYHENINNSVFVNRMVVWHMQLALNTWEWLKTHYPEEAMMLGEQLLMNVEKLAHWQDIINRMYIPFDAEKQLHIQFDGFFDMEYIPVPDYEPRVGGVWPILGHHRALQSQVIKQADVVMMMALLGEDVAPTQVKINNWNTYYPRTDHGSSLSPAIHAWVAARLGLGHDAYHMFEHAAMIDLNDNKGNVRDGIHGAACGGLWQAIVFGFCGLKIDEGGKLSVSPNLPEHWEQVSFNVCYRGEKVPFVVRNEG